MNIEFKKPFLQEIQYQNWNDKGVDISVLREDLVHPFINGNKWRKLKYNLVDYRNSGKKVLLTFGGAFSNHLISTAAATKENGIKAIGIVRGENVNNYYLDFIRGCGMTLHFISRNQYRNKNNDDEVKAILDELAEKKLIADANEVFIIPEGGSNSAAVKGASEIMSEISHDCQIIACACGTGATIAGISQTLLPHQLAIGISTLKLKDYFEKEIENLGGINEKIIFNYDYHFGGYAKKNKSLIEFCKSFSLKTNIPIEPVYTGKLFFAIDDLIKNDYFKSGTKVTLIHTGGIFFN